MTERYSVAAAFFFGFAAGAMVAAATAFAVLMVLDGGVR